MAAEASRSDRPRNARGRIGKPFEKGNPGRPKGIVNERAKIGQEAAAALEEKAWDVLGRLLSSPSWRARYEALKLVLAYVHGTPRQTLELTGGIGDLSRELTAALQEARLRRASLEAALPGALPAAAPEGSPALPAAPETNGGAPTPQVPTMNTYPTSEPAPLLLKERGETPAGLPFDGIGAPS